MTDVEEKAQTTDDDSGQNVPKNRTELKRLRPLGSASLPRDYSKKSNPQKKNRLISLKSFLFIYFNLSKHSHTVRWKSKKVQHSRRRFWLLQKSSAVTTKTCRQRMQPYNGVRQNPQTDGIAGPRKRYVIHTTDECDLAERKPLHVRWLLHHQIYQRKTVKSIEDTILQAFLSVTHP